MSRPASPAADRAKQRCRWGGRTRWERMPVMYRFWIALYFLSACYANLPARANDSAFEQACHSEQSQGEYCPASSGVCECLADCQCSCNCQCDCDCCCNGLDGPRLLGLLPSD